VLFTVATIPAARAASALPAPKLVAPAGGAVAQGIPAFDWGAVKKADRYQLQVAADARFGSTVTGRPIETRNTVATLEKSLADGEYFWRVRAVSGKGAAGKWSAVRSIRKAWSDRPDLQSPLAGAAIDYPATPLVLRWSPVLRAFKYIVSVATDPSLAQSVIGTKPVETSGTAFALPSALAAGKYHWAVTPVDARGFKGTPSAVGTFLWSWPSSTTGQVSDVNDDARVFDPELSWNPVAGATRYEVEINFSKDYSLDSRVHHTATSIGTTLSPKELLPNNTYYWRVRAYDVAGHEGTWNDGPSFKKVFDDVIPSVPGLRLRDNSGDPGADVGSTNGVRNVRHPLVTWDAVAGASGYELHFAPYEGTSQKFCDWTGAVVERTPATSWSLMPSSHTQPPVPGAVTVGDTWTLTAGSTYCVRVRATADFKGLTTPASVVSQWTYIDNGATATPAHVSTDANRPAFTYVDREIVPVQDAARDPRMDADDYLAPPPGAALTRNPLFTWKAVPGARSYWVVIARDAEFTNLVEIAFTQFPQHAPRYTLEDETTSYYWVVIPSPLDSGGDVATSVETNNPRAFDKQSLPPAPLAPADVAIVDGQPRFRWVGAEGAEVYELQVSTDPSFRDLSRELDSVITAATSFTPTKTYPVDAALFWRVRATSGDEVALVASAAKQFRRRLPVPVPAADNPQGGSLIPVLRWGTVQGAEEYEFQVDQADGSSKSFSTAAVAVTPTTFYGTGVWRWQVRAVFLGEARSAFSLRTPFTRFIAPPANAQAQRTKTRVLLRWDASPMAKGYRVEISRDTSFSSRVERADVDEPSFAPRMTARDYRSGGTLHWRVGTVDEGGNVGAWSTGTLKFDRALVLETTGRPRARQKGLLGVRVVDGGGKAVVGALVKVGGLGVKVRKSTGKSGRVSISVLPRKKGTLVITASRKGFKGGRIKLRVR